MSKNVLVVEGLYDKDLLQYICDKTLGPSKVRILLQTPLDLGGRNDGWRGLLDNLSTPLRGIDGDSIERLGIIMDADFSGQNSGGVNQRYNLVVDELQKIIKEKFPNISGYNFPKSPNLDAGDIFSHSNSREMYPIGLWIMPDHRNDGMLEHFVENLIINHPTQNSLKKEAAQVVANLKIKLFNQLTQTKKAELNTWLSWQEKPGQLFNLVDKNILDLTQAPNFTNWLKKVFN